jgi:hypothetical protein
MLQSGHVKPILKAKTASIPGCRQSFKAHVPAGVCAVPNQFPGDAPGAALAVSSDGR